MDAPHADRGPHPDPYDARRGQADEVEVVAVERLVTVDGSAADVWRCVSRPGELARWLDLELRGDTGEERPLGPGAALSAVDPDGTVRHLLVSEVEEGRRIAWHWWREGGELSAVEIILAPLDAGCTAVRVVETLARAGAGAGGRACASVVDGPGAEWDEALSALGRRLSRKLGVA